MNWKLTVGSALNAGLVGALCPSVFFSTPLNTALGLACIAAVVIGNALLVTGARQ